MNTQPSVEGIRASSPGLPPTSVRTCFPSLAGRLLTILLTAGLAASSVRAATIVVTKSTDGGPGSLRDAVENISVHSSESDTITFDPALPNLTVTLTNLLILNGHVHPLTIDGDINHDGKPDVTIKQTAAGCGVFQVFDGEPPQNKPATLKGLIITGGDDVVLGNGGAVAVFGSVTITNCLITNNYSAKWGGGIGLATTFAVATVTHSTISDNLAGIGGGISVEQAGLLTVRDCTISDNHSLAGGGGIEVEGGFAYTRATITSSTISSNYDESVEGGGGILAVAGVVNVTNCTIYGNHADSGGGAIRLNGWNEGTPHVGPSISVTVINSTISGNESVLLGGALGILVDPFDRIPVNLTLGNTIIADNPHFNCSNSGGGTVVSLGFNLDTDGTCGLNATGDISKGTANLGPLQDNGGPTFTQALLPGSDAIDQIPPTNCLVETDQRGVKRPQPINGNCDIGAYEVVQEAPVAPDQTFARGLGLSLKIPISLVLSNCSGAVADALTLTGLGASAQGATIYSNADTIFYLPANNSDDSFSYTIGDGKGGTATGTLLVQVVNPGGLAQSVSVTGGEAAVHFVGIPGFTYDIERATNPGGPWGKVDTLTAPPGGVFIYTDPSPPTPTAFYRLVQHNP